MTSKPLNEPTNTSDKPQEQDYKNPPSEAPRREKGQNALEGTSPQDSRADEKVIFNQPQTKANQ